MKKGSLSCHEFCALIATQLEDKDFKGSVHVSLVGASLRMGQELITLSADCGENRRHVDFWSYILRAQKPDERAESTICLHSELGDLLIGSAKTQFEAGNFSEKSVEIKTGGWP